MHLNIRRHPDRGDAYITTVLLNLAGGPLSAHVQLNWRGQRCTSDDDQVQGLRIVCNSNALTIWATELRAALAPFPKRLLPKNRLHLKQPT